MYELYVYSAYILSIDRFIFNHGNHGNCVNKYLCVLLLLLGAVNKTEPLRFVYIRVSQLGALMSAN